jgi:hypothetical protein
MDQWPEELKRNVNMCIADPRSAALWWTKDRICTYNEPYSLTLGKRHPVVFGRSFAEAWPELHANFSPHFDEIILSGQAASGDDAFYMVERNGYCEELWASWGIIPVQAGDGNTGFYNPVFETTRQVVSERRMSTLMLLGRCTSAAKDTQDFWKQVVRGLDQNHYDIPFVAIYAVAAMEQIMNRSSKLSDQWEAASQTSKTPSKRSSTCSDRQWTLEGMLGLPTNCSGLPSRLDAESGATLTPNFNEIVARGKITLLTSEDGTFPRGLQGVAKSRAFGDDCTAAVLCPVGPTNRENVLGFMLIGVNPRHAYDDDYQSFIKILSRQKGTSIASVVVAEEEIKCSKIAAELATQDRIRLSQQLAVTKQEAKCGDACLGWIGLRSTDPRDGVQGLSQWAHTSDCGHCQCSSGTTSCSTGSRNGQCRYETFQDAGTIARAGESEEVTLCLNGWLVLKVRSQFRVLTRSLRLMRRFKRGCREAVQREVHKECSRKSTCTWLH